MVKTGKTVIFPEKSGQIVPFLPWKDRSTILRILDPNYLSFYLKWPRKCQKTYNFDIFSRLSQICTSPTPKCWEDPKFDHIPLCVYY